MLPVYIYGGSIVSVSRVPILFGWFSWQLVSGEEALASRSSVSLPTFLTAAGSLSQVGEDLGQLVDDNVVGCQGRNLIGKRQG